MFLKAYVMVNASIHLNPNFIPLYNGDFFYSPLQLNFSTHLFESFIIYCSLRLHGFGKKWLTITIKMVETKKYDDITAKEERRENLESSGNGQKLSEQKLSDLCYANSL